MTTPVIADIDAQTAYDLLAAAVELAGRDHVYEPPNGDSVCVYVEPDLSQPSCIVGVALSIHGVPLADLNVASVALQLGDYLPCVTWPAALVFNAAQCVQDGAVRGGAKLEEHTWGRALGAAAAKLAEIKARRA